MNQSDERDREHKALRERLWRLSEASLRINESLDSARSLTAARYGVITLLDDSGGIQDFLSSGMTGEEVGRLWDLPDGMRLFEYLGSISEPLRLPDLLGHIRSMGLPELRSPVAVRPVVSFLAAPVLHLPKSEPPIGKFAIQYAPVHQFRLPFTVGSTTFVRHSGSQRCPELHTPSTPPKSKSFSAFGYTGLPTIASITRQASGGPNLRSPTGTFSLRP